jgi:hypothetical protein
MLVGRKIGHPFHREFVVGALAEDEALFFCLYDNWRLMGFERLSAQFDAISLPGFPRASKNAHHARIPLPQIRSNPKTGARSK